MVKKGGDAETKVMDFVAESLDKEPDVTTKELYKRAKSEFPAVKKLTLRQFNARFPLQIKRKASLLSGSGRRSGPGRRKKGGTDKKRDAVRSLLTEFAQKAVDAHKKDEVFSFMSEVDSYVDKVLKAGK